MQYIWQHRLYRNSDMVTNDGLKVRVIDPGLLNTDAGPDFFNAKIEIDGHLWAGNVELHVRATDWKRHGHAPCPHIKKEHAAAWMFHYLCLHLQCYRN